MPLHCWCKLKMKRDYQQKSMVTNFMVTRKCSMTLLICLVRWISVGHLILWVLLVISKCVKIIVSALWYIDPCRKQFIERGIHLPSVLDQFQGYNDWKTKKKPQLSFDLLNLHLDHLTQLLNQLWLFKPHFKELHGMISCLAEGLDKYRVYLKHQTDSMKVAYSSLTPARTISESIELICIPVIDRCDCCYSQVQESLENKPMYCPIFFKWVGPRGSTST